MEDSYKEAPKEDAIELVARWIRTQVWEASKHPKDLPRSMGNVFVQGCKEHSLGRWEIVVTLLQTDHYIQCPENDDRVIPLPFEDNDD